MSTKKKFFYNGLLLTVVGLAVRSVSMAFNSYVSRTVGAEGIGLFTLIMTVYSFAVTFASSGISLTVTRLVAAAIGDGQEGNVRRIMRFAVIYSLIFSSFASVVLFFGAEYFGGTVLGDGRAVLPLRILALSLIPLSLSSAFGGYFVGVKRVARNAVVQVLGQACRIFLTVFLVLGLMDGDVERTTAALCLSITLTELAAFLVSLLQFVFDKRRIGAGVNRPAAFCDVTSMAIPLALSAYIRSALLTVEHVLIPARLRHSGSTAAEALASYGVLHGMTLPLLLYPMSPLSSFSGLLVPEFAESLAKGEHSRMSRIASDALNATLTYAVGAAAILHVFAEELGYVIYNSYYAGHYISLMAVVVPIMYLDHVTDAVLKGIGEQVYSMWVNISDSLLSVILIWFLIPGMGIGGYAVVIVIMEGYNFLLSMLRLRKRVTFKINLTGSVIIPLLAAGAAAHICRALFLMNGAGATPLWLFLKILFAVAAFLLFLMVAKKLHLPTLRQKNEKLDQA